MIVKNESEQWIGCTVCEEVVELRRRTVANPETVLILMERMREDHTGCEQYKDDPRRARIEREFGIRMRREMERAAPALKRGLVA